MNALSTLVISKTTGQKGHQWELVKINSSFPRYDPVFDPTSGQVQNWPLKPSTAVSQQPAEVVSQQPLTVIRCPEASIPEMAAEIVQQLEQYPQDLLSQACREVQTSSVYVPEYIDLEPVQGNENLILNFDESHLN